MLDAVIHQPQRLRIMALLFSVRQAAFCELRDALELTDGNLGAHMARLVEEGYVAQGRVLAGLRFESRFAITPRGSRAFQAYAKEILEALTPAGVAAGSSPAPSTLVQRPEG